MLIKNSIVSQQQKTDSTNNIVQIITNEQIKIGSTSADINNKSEIIHIPNNNENLNKIENKGKISIEMIVPTKTLNMLKNFQNNIYIEMENKYGCQITKRTEVMLFLIFYYS